MIRPGLLVSLVFFAVVLSGCSPEARAYEDLSALRTAVSSAGVACERIAPGPEAELVSDSGICSGSEVSLYLFDSAENLEDWTKVGTRLGPALIGPNWVVAGDRGEIDKLAGELGGETTDPAN